MNDDNDERIMCGLINSMLRYNQLLVREKKGWDSFEGRR